MLVQIEGINGAGKTTQCERIKDILEHAGRTATIVNEPGMTEMGTFLKKTINSNVPRDKITEMFLFLAVEAELHSQIIIPEHAIPGHLVLRDGGMGFFMSHHYLTTRLTIETLTYLFERASIKHRSVITVLLDIPADVALRRIDGRRKESKFDMLSRDFLKHQRDVLRHLATIMPNWIVLDGTRTVNDVCDLILSKMRERTPA